MITLQSIAKQLIKQSAYGVQVKIKLHIPLHVHGNKKQPTETATAVSDVVYWYDSEGNVRVDANGLPIEKHFYTDAEGNVAVDANGSPIAIPIDNNGIEMIDDKFQENYAAGYYTTGVLNIPTPAQ